MVFTKSAVSNPVIDNSVVANPVVGNPVVANPAVANSGVGNSAYLIQVMLKTADGQLMPVHIPAAVAGAGTTGPATLPLATLNPATLKTATVVQQAAVTPGSAAGSAAGSITGSAAGSTPGSAVNSVSPSQALDVAQAAIKQERPSGASIMTSVNVSSTTGSSSVSFLTKQVRRRWC